MTTSYCSLREQLNRCDRALLSFSKCMKEGTWELIHSRSEHVQDEMQALELILACTEKLQEQEKNDVKNLEIKLRRLQRQLRVHMNGVESDIDVLDDGIKKAKRSIAEMQS